MERVLILYFKEEHGIADLCLKKKKIFVPIKEITFQPIRVRVAQSDHLSASSAILFFNCPQMMKNLRTHFRPGVHQMPTNSDDQSTSMCPFPRSIRPRNFLFC